MGDIHPYQVMGMTHSVSIHFKFHVFYYFVSVIKLFKCIFPLLNKKGSNKEVAMFTNLPESVALCMVLIIYFLEYIC